MDDTEISAALNRLAGRDLSRTGIHEALTDCANACVAIFGVTGTGIMLADDQNVTRYVSASDGNGRLLETAEADSGQGPCTEAFIDLRPVGTEDLTQDRRWPVLSRAVAGHAVHAVLGAPVRLGGVAVGTVDLYRDEPARWAPSEIAGLQSYADVVGSVLAGLLAAERAEELAGQLQYALDHRATIERAVGYLMARDGLDAVGAFTALRAGARTGRRKIGDVAAELLAAGRPLG